MIQASWRAAKLTATFREAGMRDGLVQAVAECGDLRIEIEVPFEDWPQEEDEFGDPTMYGFGGLRMAKTAEIELT